MPRPIPLQLVMKTLKKHGFLLISQKGSHGKWRKEGKRNKNVIVKMTKKEIPQGTFQSILLQSGLEESDFRNK